MNRRSIIKTSRWHKEDYWVPTKWAIVSRQTKNELQSHIIGLPGTETNFSTLLFQPFHRRSATHSLLIPKPSLTSSSYTSRSRSGMTGIAKKPVTGTLLWMMWSQSQTGTGTTSVKEASDTCMYVMVLVNGRKFTQYAGISTDKCVHMKFLRWRSRQASCCIIALT